MPLFTLHTNLVCFSNLIFRLIDDMVILQVKSVFWASVGDMAQIIILFFLSVDIDNYHDKCQIFIS